MKAFILTLVEQGQARSSQNQAINAIKFYFEKVLGRERKVDDFDRPGRGFKLPEILTREEVKCIFNHTHNLKHEVILVTIYALGLRVGELICMKITDYNKEGTFVRIRQSKDNKDRIIPVPDKLITLWRSYYVQYRPEVFLIEGQKGGCYPYSRESIQKILKRAWH